MDDNFKKALTAWADKTAKQYEDHGLPEGDRPQAWCNDVLLDSALDHKALVDALFEVAKAEFLAACERRGHK